MEKKLIFLIVLTASAAFMNFSMTADSPAIVRYAVTNLGEFSIILVSIWIAMRRIKTFTLKSALGRSMLFICLGMLSWGIGTMAWFSYNTVAQMEVPYPSLADVGYLGMIPFAFYGMYLLLKSVRGSFDKRTLLKLSAIPILVFVPIYVIFISSALMGDIPPLEKSLNVAYPMGDVLFLSISLAMLSLIRGSKLFKPIAIISVGFIFEAFADLAFSWTTAMGTYYTGIWTDALFALAFGLIGVGMHYMQEMR